MYGLNGVALIFFGGINVLAYHLCKAGEKTRRQALHGVALILLGINLIRYLLLYPLLEGRIQLPVEFSTVAYFMVPFIILRRRKKLGSWAAYSGMTAGFFYYLAMIAAGGVLYGAAPVVEVYCSLFCHGVLYFCGMLLTADAPFQMQDRKKLALGVGLVAGRALLLRPVAERGQRFLIYILLDGACVRQLVRRSLWPVALPVYYLLLIGFILLTFRLFFRKSRARYEKFSAALPV